jgi:uncharacterized protein YciI
MATGHRGRGSGTDGDGPVPVVITISGMDFDSFTMTLLVLRDDAPDCTPEEEDALQDAHMAHLADLHAAGHLLAAGPLLDRASPFRGLSILNVSAEEALALKEDDPAVKAGKYRIIALPWMVPAGAMRFGPATFPRSVSEVAGGA